MPDQTITKDEAIAAIERCKFVCRPDPDDGYVETSSRTGKPREIVHCFLGGLGADWDTCAAIELLDHADAIYWGSNFLGPCLIVESSWDQYGFHDGRTPRKRRYAFDTVNPE